MPLDVDLEDKLIYGLTPTRFGYLAVAVLLAFACYSSAWAPAPIREVCAVVCLALGALVSWGRWRGRAADGWIVDLVCFVVRNHRLTWRSPWPSPLKALRHPRVRAGLEIEDKAREVVA